MKGTQMNTNTMSKQGKIMLLGMLTLITIGALLIVNASEIAKGDIVHKKTK